jgi:hypothetical protein
VQTSASLDRRDEYLYELQGERGGRGAAEGCGFVALPGGDREMPLDDTCLVDVGPGHIAVPAA